MTILSQLIFPLIQLLALNELRVTKGDNPGGTFADVYFRVIWNSETQICKRFLGANLALEKYGIETNPNQSWSGDLIKLFYPSKLGLWPRILNDKWINGGLPQNMDVEAHIKKLKNDTTFQIPDVSFEGTAIIDYEENLPLWRDMQAGVYLTYMNASLSLERQRNFVIPDAEKIKANSKILYEAGYKNMMVESLKTLIQLRPNGLWGYWGFPICARTFDEYFCDMGSQKKNDETQWLYDVSQALYPNIYLSQIAIPDSSNRATYILKIMNEAMRLANKRQNGPIPIYAYARYHYEKAVFPSFLTPADIESTIGQAIDTGMNGLIWWGFAEDVKNCTLLSTYISTVLGPLTDDMLDYAKKCSDAVCSGKGRCIRREFSSQPPAPKNVTNFKVKNYLKFWANGRPYPNNFDGYTCICFSQNFGPQCQDKKREYTY